MNIRNVYLSTRKLYELIEEEVTSLSTYERSPSRRLWLWRRGFLSKSDFLYDLDESTYRRYVSDFERFVRTKRINGQWAIALDNKLFFHRMLEPFAEHRPAVFGMIRDGRFLPVDSLRPKTPTPDGGSPAPAEPIESADESVVSAAGPRVSRLLESEGKLVLKWIKGGGGNNVLLCSWEDGEPAVNGERMGRGAFESMVEERNEYLVCEFVEQGEFGASLFPKTPNTIRIVTMYDDERGEAFAPIAIHRMGSDRSGAIDNFVQGGLNAEVDVETGELGRAVQLPTETTLVRHSTHPDTGAQIEGTRVPSWDSIRDRVLEMANAYPHIPYVGWDVVPTDADGGFKIIEANSYPGTNSLQVHRPLLADDRARRFYERHGVLRRD
ncbi:sugar-transfer associated ATP-grasp domain-containing protein [Halegenticoccus tardaugens]|uniref:sugar-transfer associated ATP-grasp domain-containing protein n=1 Tax=Halegenticoccus tardaugens TaxID=2071624 RepID=UPI00100A3A8F|nr:sugar-transfer associated ATP-grasp domain-containing protein [Halegenticoccus tardaugens]